MCFPGRNTIENLRTRQVPAQNQDLVGSLLILTAATTSLGAILFSCSMIVIGFDPFKYVFEEFLPNAYNRSMEVIVSSYLARFLLTSLCVCEFIRFATFLVFILAMMALLTVSVLTKMQNIHGCICIHFYTQLRIMFQGTFAVLSHPLGLLMFLTHLATVFFLWFGIRCWEFVPFILDMISVITGLGLIAYAAFITTKCGVVREIAEHIINSNKIRNFSRRANRVNRKYYFYALWTSQLPIGVPCGSLFTIEKSFTMAYLRELANNLADAVILMNPSSL